MNGILWRLLFGRARSTQYQSIETRLTSIEQYLPKAVGINQGNTLHAETILVETFHHASIAAYQAEDEINSTFNIYLILTGIIATGLPVILGFSFQTQEQRYLYLPTIFFSIAAIMLGLVAILSFCFLERFIQLSKERFDAIKTLNNIQDYYRTSLEAQMPDIDKVLPKQRDDKKGFRVPLVALLTVTTVGSLCFVGAIAIVTPTLFWSIISSIIGFAVSLIAYLGYYKMRILKLKKAS